MKRLWHSLIYRHKLELGENHHGYAYVWANCKTCNRIYITGVLRPFMG